MHWKIALWVAVTVCLAGCSSVEHKTAATAPADPLQEFQKRAAQYDSVISLPSFETATNEIRQTLTNTIAAGDAALDRIGALDAGEVTFDNTVRALDDLGFQLALVDNRLSLIEQTSTNAAVRDAATDAIKELEDGWSASTTARMFTGRSRPTPTRSRG